MPLIKLEYDDQKIGQIEIESLAQAIRDIVSRVTNIEDVFVYANSSQIKIQIAPIEIFIEMNAKKIDDAQELIGKIKSELSRWKVANSFVTSINLTLIPMDWVVEVGV